MGCHDVQRRKVGPSFRAIAERYATQAGAADALAVKIRQGSRGAWGMVAMPANLSITPEEARVIAGWVLEQR
jgi:cytochrome c